MSVPRITAALALIAGVAACGLTPTDGKHDFVPVGGDNLASRAADHAVAMVGTPYRYGGVSPSSGFDCSGLVQYSYQRAGLALPRQTDDQLRRGRHVSTSQLLRGDLLFFDQDGKRASHVGVYLGGGKFVHAPSTGKRVRVDSLDSAYWRRYLSDTRRYAD